ncbi:30S ribosomal protein S6 [bacterium]|nr:30S ribosomal protein S6 [bacterium]
MVRRYELMVILDPNQSDEVLQEQIGKIEALIKGTEGGEILNLDNWGKKRLAYEIQGRPFGVYVVFEFNMDTSGTTELERHCRLDALNLRHLLLVIPEKVLKLKEREKELKSSLEERRRKMAEQSEDAPVVDMLSSIVKEETEPEEAEGESEEKTDEPADEADEKKAEVAETAEAESDEAKTGGAES